jgi:hypothetical protein
VSEAEGPDIERVYRQVLDLANTDPEIAGLVFAGLPAEGILRQTVDEMLAETGPSPSDEAIVSWLRRRAELAASLWREVRQQQSRRRGPEGRGQ